MSVIQTGTIPAVVQEGVDAFITLYDMVEPLLNRFCTVKKSSKAYEQIVKLVGMGYASAKDQSARIALQKIDQDYTARSVHITYGAGYAISKETKKYNLYDEVIPMLNKSLMNSFLSTKESVFANYLTDGFVALHPDGQALFSTAHPAVGGTYANKLAVDLPLSERSIESLCILIASMKDDNGIPIRVSPQKLMCHPQNLPNAQRALKTVSQTGTANNDINVVNLEGWIKELIVNNYLANENAYFISTDVQNGLTFYQGFGLEDVIMDTDSITHDVIVTASESYSVLAPEPRGVVASDGV